ncbi:MAG: hypothetical protein ACREFF_09190, partial [Candidatus Udaeobacter sp.]
LIPAGTLSQPRKQRDAGLRGSNKKELGLSYRASRTPDILQWTPKLFLFEPVPAHRPLKPAPSPGCSLAC